MTTSGERNYRIVLTIAIICLLGVIVSAAFVNAQEIEKLGQKELENIPIVEDGIISQTWDWFKSILGFEVDDPEIVRRSIIEQDIQVEGLQLVTANITEPKSVRVYQTIQNCMFGRPCEQYIGDKIENVTVGTYQVFVTAHDTIDVLPNEKCYDNGTVFICEHLWRCDGKPGTEPGCEYRIVSKELNDEKPSSTANTKWRGIEALYSRKEVITSPVLINNEKYTQKIDTQMIESIKADMAMEIVNEE